MAVYGAGKVKKVRMKVLKEFSRNLDGQIVTGHPDHPEEEGRIIHVSEVAAAVLERDKQAKPYSLRDEARDEVAEEERQAKIAELRAAGEPIPDDLRHPMDLDHEDDGEGEDEDEDDINGDREAARTTDLPGKPESAQARRGRRVRTNTGGGDTNASTNHGTGSLDSNGQNAETNVGSGGEPDPDAAPTE